MQWILIVEKKRVIFFCVFLEYEDEKGNKNVERTTWSLNAHLGGGSNCFFPFTPIGLCGWNDQLDDHPGRKFSRFQLWGSKNSHEKNTIFLRRRRGDVGPGLNNLWRNEKSHRENSPSQPWNSGHMFTKRLQKTEFRQGKAIQGF